MNLIAWSLFLYPVIKAQTCADSGVNELQLVEDDSQCIESTGCDGSCLNKDGSSAVWPLNFDCDKWSSTKSSFGLSPMTPQDSLCSTVSYALSSTPYTFTPHPLDDGPACSIVGTSTALLCLASSPPTTLEVQYRNKQAFETYFYCCAIFNDGSQYCHPQVFGISIGGTECPAGPLQFTTTVTSLEFVFQPNDAKSIDFATEIGPVFQSTDACPGVVMDSYGVFTDPGLATRFVDDGTFKLIQAQDPSLTQMTITSMAPLNFQTFYIIGSALALENSQSEILAINIYICGFETIVASPTFPAGITQTYQRGIGPQTLEHASKTGLLSSSFAGCPIQSLTLVTDAAGTLYTGLEITLDSSNLYIDTSVAFGTPLFIRVQTSGGAFYDIPLDILICGSESITGTVNPIELVYLLNSGIHTHAHSISSSLLSSDTPACPIQQYQIIDQSTMALLGDTSVTVDSTNIITDSTAAQDRALYLRATTVGGVSQDIPLMIYFCHSETILVTGTVQVIQITYQRDSVPQTLSHASISSLLSSSISQCPISQYQIITDPATGALLGGTQISADMSNIYVETTTAFSSPLWLRASTTGGAVYDAPLNIFVCGFETIQESAPVQAISGNFLLNTGTYKLDHTAATSLLSSSWPDCPIIEAKQLMLSATSTPYLGTQFSVDATDVIVDSAQLFDQQLSLRISTSGGSHYDIPVQIVIYQENVVEPIVEQPIVELPKTDLQPIVQILEPQKVIVKITVKPENYCPPSNLDTIAIACTPNQIMHPDLFQFAANTQYENGASMDHEKLLACMNLKNDLIGKNTSLINDCSTALSFSVQPPLGKQIIKFDYASQSLRVSPFDERFAGIYNCTLITLSERRIRSVNFIIKFINNRFTAQLFDQKSEEQDDLEVSRESPDMKKFYARIVKIGKQGQVEIRFSQPLNNPNITLFNQSMNLTIQPAPMTLDAIESKDPKAVLEKFRERIVVQSSDFLNFTWEAQNMTDSSLHLKMNFKYPFNVSTMDNLRDQLIIKIQDPSQFRSKKLQFLETDYMIWPIRRQFPDEEIEKQLMAASEVFVGLVEKNIIAGFVFNLVVQSCLSELVQSFQNLQIILYQTIINVQLPSNVMFFLYLLKVIANFEFFQPEHTTKQMLEFEKDDKIMIGIEKEDRDNFLNEQLIDMGYENFNPVLNLGGIIFTIAAYFLLLLLVLIIKLLKICYEKAFPNFKKLAKTKIQSQKVLKQQKEEKRDEEIRKMTQKALAQKRSQANVSFEGGESIVINKRREICFGIYLKISKSSIRITELVMFQFVFSMVTEAFMTLLVSGILWGQRVHLAEKYLPDQEKSQSEAITNVIGILSLILVSVVTITYFLMISVISLDRIQTVSFRSYIGYVLERLKLDTRFQVLYNFWFTSRRLIIAVVALFLQDYAGMQLVLFMSLNLATMVYIGLARPFKRQILNRTELISEFLTSVVAILEVIFTPFVTDPWRQFQVGWIFIALISICIAFFQSFIVKEMIRFAKLRYLKIFHKRKGSLNENKQEEEKEKNKPQAEVDNEMKQEERQKQKHAMTVTFGLINASQNGGDNEEEEKDQDQQQEEVKEEKIVRITEATDRSQALNSHLLQQNQPKIKTENRKADRDNQDYGKQQSQNQYVLNIFAQQCISLASESPRVVIQKSLKNNSSELNVLKVQPQPNESKIQKTHSSGIQKNPFGNPIRAQDQPRQQEESSDEWQIHEANPQKIMPSSSKGKQIQRKPEKRDGSRPQKVPSQLVDNQRPQGMKNKIVSKNDKDNSKQEEFDSEESEGVPEPVNDEIKKWLFNETLGRSEMPNFYSFEYPTGRLRLNKQVLKYCLPVGISGLTSSMKKIDEFLLTRIMTGEQRLQLRSLKEIYEEKLEEVQYKLRKMR